MLDAGRGREPIRLLSRHGLTVVGSLAAIYLVSQILRNSIGVIAPNLADEIGLSAAELGLLSSAFFVAFALAQAPLGIGIDRFGPKPCILVCTVILVVGGVLFATATTPTGLIAARILIGFGSSCYLMAPLAFYARRFPPERFSTLAGMQIGIGTIGTLISTAPLAMSSAAIGWRTTFIVIAVGIALAGVLVAFAVPGDRGGATPIRREAVSESVAGLLVALRTPHVPQLFVMHLMSYSSLVLIVGLWGGPYLTHVYGYGLIERGDLLFLAAAAQTLGLFLNGPLERFAGNIKVPVVIGAGMTGLLLLALAVAGTLPLPGLVAWLIAFGLFAAYSPLLIAHGKALFPPDVLGRGMTLLNIGTMFGVFASQAVTGVVIDLFPVEASGAYPLAAYRLVFALQAGCMLAAILPYLRVPEPQQR